LSFADRNLTISQDLVALVVQAVGGGMASSAKTLAAANDVRAFSPQARPQH
jgi:hypothetical protein